MENFNKTSLLGIELALFTIFTSSSFLLFTWGSVIGYYLTILLASFLSGAVLVDFERTLKLVSIAFIASCIGFVLLNILPVTFYGEAYTGEINSIVALNTAELSRKAIISFPIAIFTCLFGCFLGEALV